MRLLAVVFSVLLVSPFVEAAAPTTIVVCKTGIDRKSTISLLAEASVEGKRLSLKLEDRSKSPPQTTTGKAFTDMPDADLVGNVVMSKCVEGVLVFALDYGPPYRKGVAVRMHGDANTVQRIDFAEKALPRWLYVNASQMSLVMPNLGGESKAKYLQYAATADSSKPSPPIDADRLPAKAGFAVKRLR
jgi:hypothetical protein